mmetsp:Transcript_9182/g.17350  ORF Transcript_9182/g.17350 Transcript_9182/m.17350 type:complete len:204 (-) Transcript_9182:2444-3055(-)
MLVGLGNMASGHKDQDGFLWAGFDQACFLGDENESLYEYFDADRLNHTKSFENLDQATRNKTIKSVHLNSVFDMDAKSLTKIFNNIARGGVVDLKVEMQTEKIVTESSITTPTDLTKEVASGLASVLKASRDLRSLHIHGNQVTDATVQEFTDGLLENNRISNFRCQKISFQKKGVSRDFTQSDWPSSAGKAVPAILRDYKRT